MDDQDNQIAQDDVPFVSNISDDSETKPAKIVKVHSLTNMNSMKRANTTIMKSENH